MLRAAVLMLIAGCGRVGFDPGAAPLEPAPDADLALVCGPAYQVLPGLTSRYRVAPGSASWSQAELACEQDGGHLIVIDDAAEQPLVTDLLASASWIGVSDHLSEGAFVTVTGAALGFTAWKLDEPNDEQGDEDCGESLPEGWNDNACSILRPYICECDGTTLPAPAVWCVTGIDTSCNTCGDVCPTGTTCSTDQQCLAAP